MNKLAVKTDQFADDVLKGLNSIPKKLSSKYFYDKKGDSLFQKIMQLDEYYLTRSEYEILNTYKNQILNIFYKEKKKFNLVELGAGDGYKTKVLLKEFLEAGVDFQYNPIDISGNVLQMLDRSLHEELPALKFKGIQNEYSKGLKKLKKSGDRNVVLFLGSNIGNFSQVQAISFLEELYESMGDGDLLFIGFDLKKDPQIILNAYNDSSGVTRDFNLNLLTRINHELKGNFDLTAFKHFPTYDPKTGTTKSYLVSTRDQEVEIMGNIIEFDQWEAIQMEISQKYSMSAIENMAAQTDFSVIRNFYDTKKYFVDTIWKK